MNSLAKIRNEKDISYVQLSELSGVCAGVIRKLEKDNNIATAHWNTKVRLANALGVTVRELVTGESEDS